MTQEERQTLFNKAMDLVTKVELLLIRSEIRMKSYRDIQGYDSISDDDVGFISGTETI